MVGGEVPARALDDLAERVRPVTLAHHQRVAVLPQLETLLPEGLPQGAVVAVAAAPGVTGTMTLALALAAGPSLAGAWVAAVGTRSLGLAAAAELGVALERLVVVDPQARSKGVAAVLAALVDGFDVVVVGPAARLRLRSRDTRRLVARVRERGAVVVGVGDDLPGGSAQIRLLVTASTWEGIDQGAGHLQTRRTTVEVAGRGAASRSRQVQLRFPLTDEEEGEDRVVPLPLRQQSA
ncbi:MAG TPA: hypothetical protein VGJ86_19140 [Acidimicrobiales bacterium]|jgi:GNAT superfamily N-acetyltransferase